MELANSTPVPYHTACRMGLQIVPPLPHVGRRRYQRQVGEKRRAPMIYRIAEAQDWETAQAAGYFASADLAAEGFIHCCTAQQITAVANRYYQGREILLLLEIDETRVPVPLKWEDLTSAGQLFPHVYGPIPLAAVRRCVTLQPGPDDGFS